MEHVARFTQSIGFRSIDALESIINCAAVYLDRHRRIHIEIRYQLIVTFTVVE